MLTNVVRGGIHSSVDSMAPVAKKPRRQGRKKPLSSIPEKGVADLSAELLEGSHAAYFARTTDAARRLHNIVDSLQHPPRGPFTNKDLRWILTISEDARRGPSRPPIDLERPPDREDSDKAARVAYIPWGCVHDFIAGEEGHRSDIDTKFVCTRRH